MPNKQELVASLIWTLNVSGEEEMTVPMCIEGTQLGVLIEEMWGVGGKGKEKIKEHSNPHK